MEYCGACPKLSWEALTCARSFSLLCLASHSGAQNAHKAQE